MIEGHGFSFPIGWWPATRPNQPTGHWSYLYILVLAAIYAVAGPAPLVARLVQSSMVSVLHPWLVWRITNRLFGATAGLAAAIATACYGYFVYYAGALVTESLYILAVLWVLDIATAMVCAPSPSSRVPAIRPWLLLGLAAGLATLLRQAFLLMVPVVLAGSPGSFSGRAGANRVPTPSLVAIAGRAASALAVVVLLILPWTVRNYNAFGQFVPLNTNAGLVMFWADHPVHGTSFIPILRDGPVSYATLLPKDVAGLNEAAIDRELLRLQPRLRQGAIRCAISGCR